MNFNWANTHFAIIKPEQSLIILFVVKDNNQKHMQKMNTKIPCAKIGHNPNKRLYIVSVILHTLD